jgi:hypothetical protein
MSDMSKKVYSTIRYDGPLLADHSMDVADLAPALLALSDLLKIANDYANNGRAGIKVKVNADLDQKCFQLNIDLAVTIWEQAKLLLDDENVIAAERIAAWVGIISGTATFTGLSLFKLIKFLRGRTVNNVTVVKISDGTNLVEVSVEGEAKPIIILQPVYELYANTDARKKAIDVMAPLRTEGYDTLEFDEKNDTIFSISESEVPERDMSDLPEVIPQNVNISKIRTGVRIRKASYEGNSKWTVMYKRAIEAPILHTIWLANFQSNKISAPPGSSLDVDLEETYITNELGELIGDPTYKILHVYAVMPPPIQTTLGFRDET